MEPVLRLVVGQAVAKRLAAQARHLPRRIEARQAPVAAGRAPSPPPLVGRSQARGTKIGGTDLGHVASWFEILRVCYSASCAMSGRLIPGEDPASRAR